MSMKNLIVQWSKKNVWIKKIKHTDCFWPMMKIIEKNMKTSKQLDFQIWDKKAINGSKGDSYIYFFNFFSEQSQWK